VVIELLVMGFALASLLFGTVIPVIGFATYVDLRERRILTMLRMRLLEAHVAPEARDGALGVAVSVVVGERTVVISARERGRTPIWRVEVARESTLPVRYVVVRKDWATARGFLSAATHREIDGLPLHRLAFEDAGAPPPDDAALARALAPVLHGLELKELSVDSRALTFDVAREGLEADDVFALLLRCLHVVSSLEGRGPAALPGLPLTGPGAPLLLPRA